MYIQFKQGFIEADRWDGSEIPVKEHQAAALNALKFSGRNGGERGVIIVRARERQTIEWVNSCCGAGFAVKSPPGWDYEWRCYLTAVEWGKALAQIAADLDYRNFKAWSHSGPTNREDLAHRIWHAAHETLSGSND